MKTTSIVHEVQNFCREITRQFPLLYRKIRLFVVAHPFPYLFKNIKRQLPLFYCRTRLFIVEHPFPSIVTSIVLLLTILMFSFPQEGAILPADPYIVDALSLLNTTETGKKLMKRVKRSSAGSYIYLSLGTTAGDRLIDFHGDTVRGVTRVTYELSDRMTVPKRVAVITNRDLVGTAPRDIIRSLAYELENVDYSFRNPQLDFPSDSPVARETQKKIMEELNL